ncbi:hypothetical protein [Kitasatospora sp. NPDC057223]|uniref:hypothetical protein n=1 Tax=Kitasatospora sp. NPDC057223 TaxID=3346055 RepID=UPI0036392083
METLTGVVAGVVLVLFGGALLFWCAVEVRLRHRVRRHGIPTAALVVADGDPYGALDSAPLLTFCTLPSVGGQGGPGAADGGVPSDGAVAGRAETVLARPRGHTPLRRPARLVPGTEVRVAYDPRRPARVVLAAADTGSTLAGDVMWLVLSAASLAAGGALLAALTAR